MLKYIVCAIGLSVSVHAAAQDSNDAYSFLDIPMSSRIYGLGGVNITLVDDDVSVIDQNPALLGPEVGGQTVLTYMRYMADSNFAGARYAHSAGEHGAWSAALQYFGYGAITATDEYGNQLGKFSPKDMLVSLAYAHDINDRWRGGITMKTAYSAYDEYTAWAIAADLGINYFDPDSDLSLSLVAANLGGQLKRLAERYDRLPIDVRIGVSKVLPAFPLRLSATAWRLTKKHFGNVMRHIVLSADVVASPNWHVGIGYNYNTRAEMRSERRSLLSGFSLAAGLQVSRFGVGIALAQPASGATNFMLNLRMNIDY